MEIIPLKIRLYGDSCLRKKSEPLKEVGAAERLLIQAMIVTMHAHKGVGLAAPQVGINQRLIVVDVGDGPVALINPQILTKKGTEVMEEGCLSIPGILVNVKRPKEIRVKYLDEYNQPKERTCSELMARVILHETDHLNGKLIVDYLSLTAKAKLKKQLNEIKKQNQSHEGLVSNRS